MNNIDKKEAIRLSDITKRFGEITANDRISLNAYYGEILSLLGENGSGKTTLMNMLSGIYQPDEGEIFIDGKHADIRSPEDSRRLGIGMIHQHFKLVDIMSAADNILLGASDAPLILRGSRRAKIDEITNKFSLSLDSSKLVHDMSVSEKQTLEIVKVLYYGAKILILDEPTAVLTPQETRSLFKILRHMRDEGCAIIIITHKLAEVMELSDRVAILRRGHCEAVVNTAETSPEQLTELMVGRAVKLEIDRPKPKLSSESILSVHHLTISNSERVPVIRDISFELYGGEILGVAGVAGSGQKELCEAIAGLCPIDKGAILCQHENIEGKTPSEIIRLGVSMSFVPEDRLGMGLAASLGIADNMLLKSYRSGSSPFVDRKSAETMADKIIKRLEIAAPNSRIPVRMLSGGNVQKVLLGREIEANPKVIITAYPVRGLDINSSYMIYSLLNEQKQRGAGVLFIGEDLDVMLELCDRIMVLCHGEITGIEDAKKLTKDELGLLMTGSSKKEAQNYEKAQKDHANTQNNDAKLSKTEVRTNERLN